jgi:hypothetical protein
MSSGPTESGSCSTQGSDVQDLNATEGRLRVGLVTCGELPEPDLDAPLLLAALRQSGVDAELVAWDDPDSAPPEVFDRLILRSAWNYHLRPAEFSAWVEAADRLASLSNPAPIVLWNLHKQYLKSLTSAGIPTVPTAWIQQGARAPLRSILEVNGWTDFVIKPAISASSWRTHRFRLAHDEIEQAESILETLLSDRDVMVQPYVEGVDRNGEKCVMWIDGEVTHAVRKTPRFAGEGEFVSGATTVSSSERAIAERSIAVAVVETGVRPLYARVDLMPDAEEGPMVSELELIEPSLYLVQSAVALDRLVRAIATAPAS